MFDEFMDVGVSSQGAATTLREEFLACFTIFGAFMYVGVSVQGADTSIRG